VKRKNRSNRQATLRDLTVLAIVAAASVVLSISTDNSFFAPIFAIQGLSCRLFGDMDRKRATLISWWRQEELTMSVGGQLNPKARFDKPSVRQVERRRPARSSVGTGTFGAIPAGHDCVASSLPR
jgi:hypothetical protein